MLTQDHSLFPAFSVWENIAIGDPALCLSLASLPPAERRAALAPRVREAARLGGALEFVEKLPSLRESRYPGARAPKSPYDR